MSELLEYNLLVTKCGYGKEPDKILVLNILFPENMSLTHKEPSFADLSNK